MTSEHDTYLVLTDAEKFFNVSKSERFPGLDGHQTLWLTSKKTWVLESEKESDLFESGSYSCIRISEERAYKWLFKNRYIRHLPQDFLQDKEV